MPVLARRRTPAGNAAVRPRPDLRTLRLILVPRARIEEAKVLVQKLVELGKELDHLSVRIAVIDRDVVSGAVPQRTPDDRYPVERKYVAAVLQMREVAELKREVVHHGALALHEIHGVVVGIAAHEHED